jgi:hypothetical protein
MQRHQHPKQRRTVCGVDLFAKATGAPVDEREQCECVSRADAEERLASCGGQGCDDELKPTLPESQGGVECDPQTLEGSFTRLTQPILVIQIVHGHEVTPACSIGDDPVVAAKALGEVRAGVDFKAPPVRQGVE